MLIIGLWVLAFLGAGTCIALTALNSTDRNRKLPLPAIQTPQKTFHIHPAMPADFPGDQMTIRKFLQQMDSLRLDSIGHRSYDSICHFRPGLIDSARTAEKLYNLLNTLK